MPEKRSGSWRWWTIIVVVVMAAIAGVWYFQHQRDDTPHYETAPVKRGDIVQEVTATGTLNPVTNILVGCQVSGRISELLADFNTRVKAGQLIAQIDPRIYQAQVEQATADLASAKANLELQQVEAKRAGDLFTNKLISESDYDTAMATLHEAQASVQIKQAALNNAKANLAFCDIYSPVDGVVISRNVDVGQTVAASLSAPTLFQIANTLTRMQIDANVDEADVGGVKTGQSVSFTVDAYPGRTFYGTVRQVRNAPTTVNNVVTYDSVISVTNADLKLKPGMTANVSIITAEHNNVLEIPNSALRFQPADTFSGSQTNQIANSDQRTIRRGRHGRNNHEHGEPSTVRTVYMLKNDDASGKETLEPMKIQTGITDNIFTEVTSGLKEGDQIVTGLTIPGMSSNQRTRNPFSSHHRF